MTASSRVSFKCVTKDLPGTNIKKLEGPKLADSVVFVNQDFSVSTWQKRARRLVN